MSRLKRAAQIIVAMLREIFDESAYERFLKRAKLQPSMESYSAFSREREAARNHCPKCC